MNEFHRKSPRIPDFDYSAPHYYFVTICTHEKRMLFGQPKQLNVLGRIAEQDLLAIPTHFPQVQVNAYVVMPNHIHAILSIQDSQKPVSLNTVIGQFKSGAARKIHARFPDLEVWQRSYYDTILRSEKAYLEALQYIENNPLKWELSKEI